MVVSTATQQIEGVKDLLRYLSRDTLLVVMQRNKKMKNGLSAGWVFGLVILGSVIGGWMFWKFRPLDAWAPILTSLNQPPLSGEISSDLVGIDRDLLEINRQEMAAIQNAWEKFSGQQEKGTRRGVMRNERNRFFFEKVKTLNQQNLSFLRETSGAHEKNYREIARGILRRVNAHPLTNAKRVDQFHEGSQIGFCFGRALVIHYWLLEAGVPQGDILKIFNVGRLKVNGVLWRFHVGVMVRDAESGYIVIDPLEENDKILSYQQWVDLNSTYEMKSPLSRARFYVTDPRKFLPAFGAYHLDQLKHPVLTEYFDRLPEVLVSQ